MTYYSGTLTPSPIVRGSSGDTFGTHHSVLGVGGFIEVNNLTERNALPIDTVNGIYFDGISSGQRRLGMLVYSNEDDITYQLKISLTTWGTLTTSEKLTALSDNNNWEIFIDGSQQLMTGEKIYKQLSQITHGFVVGDVIGFDGIEYVKVSSLTAATVEPLGVVTKVIDVNTFILTYSGYISTSGMTDVYSSGLTNGTLYYLSSTAGKLIDTKPSTSTELSKPMLVNLSGDTGVVVQYRGIYEILTSGGTVSYEEFTGYTATTQVYLDETVSGVTNLGYFTGYTGIQTLPISHLLTASYDGNYLSLYNNYYRDSSGYIRIGSASDGIARRGFLKSATLPIASWVWNEYTGDGAPIGWIFVNGDVSSDSIYGHQLTGSSNVVYSTPAYSATTWTEGQYYNNGSEIVIDTVSGSTLTGSTYVSSGPFYRDKSSQEFNVRTIVTTTPDHIQVTYDDYFVKLSANTSNYDAANSGTGVGIFSGHTNGVFYFKSLIPDNGINIFDNGDSLIIAGGGGSSVGDAIVKEIALGSHGFVVGDVIGWSNGTYSKATANANYDGEVIGIVSSVPTVDDFFVTQVGYISGLTGLSTNEIYYVSTNVAGDMTITKPTSVGNKVREILIATSSSTGWVFPGPGYFVESPITTIESATTTNYYATDLSGLISVYTGTTDVYLPATPRNGQEITIADASGTAKIANVTVHANGKNMSGTAYNTLETDALINTNWGVITFIYNGIFWVVKSSV